VREILKDIFTWPWFSEPHGYNFNGYLVCHPGGNLCIDPVEPTEDVLEEIARYGVSRILLTNRNHSRAANRVRARAGARTDRKSTRLNQSQSNLVCRLLLEKKR